MLLSEEKLFNQNGGHSVICTFHVRESAQSVQSQRQVRSTSV